MSKHIRGAVWEPVHQYRDIYYLEAQTQMARRPPGVGGDDTQPNGEHGRISLFTATTSSLFDNKSCLGC